MALRCPFLTKLPMNLIKSQPAAVLKFAEICPFASANLNLNLLKSFSSLGGNDTKNLDGKPNADPNDLSNANKPNNNLVDQSRRESSSLAPKVRKKATTPTCREKLCR